MGSGGVGVAVCGGSVVAKSGGGDVFGAEIGSDVVVSGGNAGAAPMGVGLVMTMSSLSGSESSCHGVGDLDGGSGNEDCTASPLSVQSSSCLESSSSAWTPGEQSRGGLAAGEWSAVSLPSGA